MRRLRRCERGSVTIWVLGLSIGVLFLGGISTDLWRAFSERRALAGMADAASVAGAAGLDRSTFRDADAAGLDPDLAKRLAYTNLAVQSDRDAVTDALVAATPDEITVTLHGEVELTLLRIFLAAEPLAIRVTSTSGPRTTD